MSQHELRSVISAVAVLVGYLWLGPVLVVGVLAGVVIGAALHVSHT